MVLADLGRKITSALQSLSKATVINEEVMCRRIFVAWNGMAKYCNPVWPSLFEFIELEKIMIVEFTNFLSFCRY